MAAYNSVYGDVEKVAFPVNPPSQWDLDKQSAEVPGTRKEGQTGHYRLTAWPELVTTDSHPSFPKTGYETFERGVADFPDRKCLGHRPFSIQAKDFEKRYVWQTYKEIQKRRTDVGAGISKLSSEFGWPASLPIGIWTVNRPEWQITAQAANAYGYVVVALYDTLGKSVIDFCLEHAEIRVVFAASKNIPALLDLKPNHAKLDAIVSLDNFDFLDKAFGAAKHLGTRNSSDLKQMATEKGVKLYDFAEIEKLGRENPTPVRPPSPSDIAAICYTSGTSGPPKGAVFTHKLMATVPVAQAHLQALPQTTQQIFFSFMPLAHCYGRWFEDLALMLGYGVGYFIGDPARLVEDMAILQPTWLVVVPRVLNKVYAKVKAATLDAPGVKGALIRHAYAVKLAALRSGGHKDHWLWDRIVFKKVQAVLGGRVALIGSGSAPLNPDIVDFMRIAFSTNIQEGYGQTEGHGTALKAIPWDSTSAGTCGPPISCTELKLVDVPDMDYRATNKPNPQGELCVRGDSVIKEYYKDPALTKEAIDAEGWLHSGDIAEVDDKGRFTIIDRKKNLVKLSQGEYVALERVENIYSTVSLAAQLVIYATSTESHLLLFVVPEPEPAAKLASSVLGKEIKPTDQAALGEALKDPKVIAAALAEFDKEAKKADLKGFEKARQLQFLNEPFKPENDTLTPTQKIKRPKVNKMLKEQADALYKSYQEPSK